MQDAEADADLFEFTADFLSAAGYPPYEISNFARPGRECAHNLAYWRGADYVGLGPSAFSTVGERRWENVRDTAAYSERIGRGEMAEDFAEAVPPAMRRAEAIAFGLRTRDGVPAQWLAGQAAAVEEHTALGLMEAIDGQRLALTRRGRLLADTVATAYV